MIEHSWVGPIVTAFFSITGWFVVYRIVRHNRKMMERIRLINQKNNLLLELSERAFTLWGRGRGTSYSSSEEREIVMRIDRILNIYKELGDLDGNRERYELTLKKLRPLITLNIENALEGEELAQKKRAIKEFIETLDSIPDKKL